MGGFEAPSSPSRVVGMWTLDLDCLGISPALALPDCGCWANYLVHVFLFPYRSIKGNNEIIMNKILRIVLSIE